MYVTFYHLTSSKPYMLHITYRINHVNDVHVVDDMMMTMDPTRCNVL
jgi:hypothetical protein